MICYDQPGASSTSTAYNFFPAILVNITSNVEIFLLGNLYITPYTVPTGKKLRIIAVSSGNAWFLADNWATCGSYGELNAYGNTSLTASHPIYFPEGTVISVTSATQNIVLHCMLYNK